MVCSCVTDQPSVSHVRLAEGLKAPDYSGK